MTNNKLTIIKEGLLGGLHNLNEISFHQNDIHTVESGAFANAGSNTVSSGSTVTFRLTFNHLSVIKWNIFLNESEKSLIRFLPFGSYLLFLFSNPLPCYRNHCWLSELENFNLKNILGRDPCAEQVKKECPKQNMSNKISNDPSLPLMCTENTTFCNAICTDIGYNAGDIHWDFGMCVAQHTCYCSCEFYDRNLCEQNCSQTDQIPVKGYQNEIGCDSCKCQCVTPNCLSECLPYQFRYINNTRGCPKCECDCADVDCDTQCGGEGLGIVVKINTTGCLSCSGCKKYSVKVNKIKVM